MFVRPRVDELFGYRLKSSLKCLECDEEPPQEPEIHGEVFLGEVWEVGYGGNMGKLHWESEKKLDQFMDGLQWKTPKWIEMDGLFHGNSC